MASDETKSPPRERSSASQWWQEMSDSIVWRAGAKLPAFAPEPEDADFRPNRVEPLLRQSAELLGRAAADAARADSLAIDAFKAYQELKELEQLGAIHALEVAAGLYSAPLERLAREKESQSRLAAGFAAARAAAIRAKEALGDGSSLITARREAAYTGVFPLLQREWDDGGGGLMTIPYDGASRTKNDWAATTAMTQAQLEVAVQSNQLDAREAASGGRADAASSRADAYEAQRRWEEQDAPLRENRHEVARGLADERVVAITNQDGPLHFANRRAALLARVERDVRDAKARMIAAAEGLTTIYNHPVDFKVDDTNLDGCIDWVRSQISWLARFQERDQELVVPVSVSAAVGSDFEAGKDTGTWTFQVRPEMFAGYGYLRLRGVSAAVLAGYAAGGAWALRVLAPQNGTFLYDDGGYAEIDHPSPWCMLGRVGPRETVPAPDVAGAAALHDLSPVGEWTVKIAQASSAGVALDKLRDVQIDLHLVARPVATQD